MLSHRKIKALLLLFMIMLVMPVYSQVITGKVIDANNKGADYRRFDTGERNKYRNNE